jgi:coenzyme F420 biosynthesis associated uncharacterized protein
VTARPADSTLVDWGVAERVAVTISQSGTGAAAVGQEDVSRAGERAVSMVGEYTGLEPRAELPRPEAVDRPEWVRANLTAFRGMSGDVERRLAGSLRLPGPLRGLALAFAGTATAAQLGLALGYVGRKVLGQYDVALIGPARPPRLLFVAPNLAEANRRLGADQALFLHWIALHEATHAFQFAAVPWLREHIGGMVEELLGAATLDGEVSNPRAALRRLVPPGDPRRVVEHLREGGLVRLLAGPREVGVLRRLQATMAVIEGYSEHVMDAIGADLDPGYARLRAALESERARRGALDAIVATLLGLDMKLRQYRLGKRFADAVVGRAGIEGLNAVWRAPDALPDGEELEDPGRWLARVG